MAVKDGRNHSLEQILALGIPSPPPAFGLTAQRPQLGEPLLPRPPPAHRCGIQEFLGLRKESMIFKPE